MPKNTKSDPTYRQHNRDWRENFTEQGFGGRPRIKQGKLEDVGFSYDGTTERGMSPDDPNEFPEDDDHLWGTYSDEEDEN